MSTETQKSLDQLPDGIIQQYKETLDTLDDDSLPKSVHEQARETYANLFPRVVVAARTRITNETGEGTPNKILTGTVDCPICEQHKLRYRKSSYNGHIHAACENGCIDWME